MTKSLFLYKLDMERILKADFHRNLKDIENFFRFFTLSILALSIPRVQGVMKEEDKLQNYNLGFTPMLDKFNSFASLKIKKNNNGSTTSTLNIKKEMIFVGEAMAILTYDYLINSKYQNALYSNTTWRFLTFIRNAAVHGNVFSLKYEGNGEKYNGEKYKQGDWKIAEDEKIIWRDKEISRALNELNVFNDFIDTFDIFSLVQDISNELKKIDMK